MKKPENREKRPKIEREYLSVFSPHVLPSHRVNTAEDSLEQPSALKHVPTTATPFAEAYIPK
jgi:hypothetical protein